MNTKYTFEVLKTTAKGAMLITDNNHVAWVSPRSRRADGTFGSSAADALFNSTVTLDAWKEEEAEARDPKKVICLRFPATFVEDYNENCYRVLVGHTKSPYNSTQTIRVWEYLPKSQVVSVETEIIERMPITKIEVPQWIVWNKKQLRGNLI